MFITKLTLSLILGIFEVSRSMVGHAIYEGWGAYVTFVIFLFTPEPTPIHVII